MRAAAVEIRSESFRKSSSPDLSTKNAWAQIARRKFYGQNLVKACMREWDLTEGQARGVVYASITQNTIDHILKRDRIKGFALALEVTAIVTCIDLEDFLDHQAREAARAKSEWEAKERHNEALRASAAERRTFAGAMDGAGRAPGSEADGLGVRLESAPLAPRSFRGGER